MRSSSSYVRPTLVMALLVVVTTFTAPFSSASGEEPAAEPERIALWPDKTPSSKAAITLHRPANANGAAVVICPGGGYGGLVTGAEGHGIAQWLNQHGITGIVLEYELPKGRPLVPLHDAQRAIRLTRANAKLWNLDPGRIGVMGFSAGGHLASTAGTHFDAGDPQAVDPILRADCRPDFLVLIYPVISMGDSTHGGSKHNLLGKDPTAENVQLFSNETQVDKDTPPAFLAHAADDTVVVPRNSRLFHEALQWHNVASEYLELPRGGHGLNGYRGPMWDAWQTASLKWLTAQGVIPAASTSAAELAVAAPEAVGMSPSKLAMVTELMNQQVADRKIAGGIVAVARHGKVVYFEAYGKRDLAGNKPMEKDTIVRLYSMTKAVATAAALMLVEEGKIDIEVPALKYVPALADVKVWTDNGLVDPKRAITVADLMRHTAGFGASGDDPIGKALKEANPGGAKDIEEYAQRLASVPLAYHPGEKWIYSNSIDVLGLIVQKAAGKPFGDFLRERLFEPLEMSDTGFFVPADKLDRFAVNYRHSEKGLQPIRNFGSNQKYHSMPAVQSGGGGLVGTAADYMRFLLMIANDGQWNGKRYLKPESIRLMTTDQLPSAAFPIGFGAQRRPGTGFGFGFSIRTADTQWDQAGHVGEYGWGGAASTHYWVSPKDAGLIVITLEQIMPYNFDTEWLLKPVIYDAIEK